jgi:NAD(P)-dependent dehydrogenase (short-subunit alcohol dehydrogenase family)
VSPKVALVTGGASGIGHATVERLAKDGVQTLVADLSVSNGPGTVRCDVSDPEQVEAAVQAAVEQFGGLDILVNNAGLPILGLLTEMTSADFQRVLAVNVLGAFHGITFAAPAMAARGGGVIVNTASTAGLRGVPAMGAYACSKAALINLTQTAALELRPLGIRVNCVLPGMIRTPMLDGIRSTFEALSPIPIDDMIVAKQGRPGVADDIARVIAYLASDEADFVSGAAIPADNALSASLF